jgi:hypothetical protein
LASELVLASVSVSVSEWASVWGSALAWALVSG